MGSGGSPLDNATKGIGDTLESWRKDPMAAAVGYASQLLSFGTAKYNLRDKKIEAGFFPHAGDEIVGEFGGRNRARLQGQIQGKALDDAKAAADIAERARQLQEYRADVNASQGAAAIRATAAAKGNRKLGSGGSSDEDILGA